MRDEILLAAIADVLVQMDQAGDVVCATHVGHIARRIHDAVLEVVPSTGLTDTELAGVRSLMLHAVADQRFFDWEMPTLTGFSADGFRQIAEKLPGP
ncbi:hypothetical protein [Ensifer adhaerens]|uniref:hypothetical protein n=1 Tax=Ensifer adhaerens TaxID=106592 RepID=UPI000CF06166|nr:hypothetical protein [Ensifer adhaerens]